MWTIGFTYVWLIDMTDYLNHFYLVSIFSALCVFLPLNTTLALDNWLFPSTIQRASLGEVNDGSAFSATVPEWTYFLLRAETTIVYLYASFAKINVDWLYARAVQTSSSSNRATRRGEPLRHWLRAHDRDQIPILGELFKLEIASYFFSYSGLIFDMIAPGLLLWRPTRVLGFVSSAMFHVLNKIIFNIGVRRPVPLCLTSITDLSRCHV